VNVTELPSGYTTSFGSGSSCVAESAVRQRSAAAREAFQHQHRSVRTSRPSGCWSERPGAPLRGHEKGNGGCPPRDHASRGLDPGLLLRSGLEPHPHEPACPTCPQHSLSRHATAEPRRTARPRTSGPLPATAHRTPGQCASAHCPAAEARTPVPGVLWHLSLGYLQVHGRHIRKTATARLFAALRCPSGLPVGTG
jgi:hypothetical protein